MNTYGSVIRYRTCAKLKRENTRLRYQQGINSLQVKQRTTELEKKTPPPLTNHPAFQRVPTTSCRNKPRPR